LPPFLQSFPFVVTCQLAGLWAAGKFRRVWHFFATPELAVILRGVLLGSGASMLTLLMFTRFHALSRGVFLIDAALLAILLIAARVALVASDEYVRRRTRTGIRVLVYGAGHGGALVARELLQNEALDRFPIGFIDDDPAKRGLRIEGLRVLGSASDIDNLAGKHRLEEILISTDKIAAAVIDRLRQMCDTRGIAVRRLRFQLEDLRDNLEMVDTRPARR
jgi:FlaA1/EpsC-like NDP-sugar epimerase